MNRARQHPANAPVSCKPSDPPAFRCLSHSHSHPFPLLFSFSLSRSPFLSLLLLLAIVLRNCFPLSLQLQFQFQHSAALNPFLYPLLFSRWLQGVLDNCLRCLGNSASSGCGSSLKCIYFLWFCNWFPYQKELYST